MKKEYSSIRFETADNIQKSVYIITLRIREYKFNKGAEYAENTEYERFTF